MKNETFNNITHELHVFLILSTVNIIFGALTMAIGISTFINNIQMIIPFEEGFFLNSFFIIYGGIASIIGIWWIILSVSNLDFITDLKIDLYKKRKNISDEYITKSIIQMVSYYRENNKTIRRMIIISKIGGYFFILIGILSIINTSKDFLESIIWLDQLLSPLGIILMFILGITSLFIPRILSKYKTIWDSRISESKDVEKIFHHQLRTEQNEK